MLNIKEHSIFSREGEGNCQECQNRRGVLAVWSSPGSGKTTVVVKLARYLAGRKRNVSLLLCDMTAPMLPYICPPGDLEFERSLGGVLTATRMTRNLVHQNCVVHKHQDYLTILSIQKRKNEYTYPPHSISQATEPTDCLRELTPYVIIDCSSYIVSDIPSVITLMETSSILRLIGYDLKPISYLSSQLPLLQDHGWDADKQYRVASSIRPNEASERVKRILGNVTFRIPHSTEVEEQILAGNLFKELSLKNSQGFRKEMERVVREMFGCQERNEGSHCSSRRKRSRSRKS